MKFDCFYTANICTVDASYNSVKFSCLCEVTQFTYLLFILSYFIPILLLKNAFEFLHKFCSKFSINIALSHVHIQEYEAYMLIKCIGSVCVLPLSFRISRCRTRHFTGAFFYTGFNWASKGHQRHPRSIGLVRVLQVPRGR